MIQQMKGSSKGTSGPRGRHWASRGRGLGGSHPPAPGGRQPHTVAGRAQALCKRLQTARIMEDTDAALAAFPSGHSPARPPQTHLPSPTTKCTEASLSPTGAGGKATSWAESSEGPCPQEEQDAHHLGPESHSTDGCHGTDMPLSFSEAHGQPRAVRPRWVCCRA